MKHFKWHKMVKILFPAAGILTIVLFFQNCADPLGLTTEQSSFVDHLPFGYDNTLDTMAYMSCGGGTSSANRQAIWSFRMGAYGAGSGLKLNQGYLAITSNFSAQQRGAALSESPNNRDANLQLAIRELRSFQSILSSNGSDPDEGEDYVNLLGPLDQSEIAQKLASADPQNPVRINYFPGLAGVSGKTIEGAIRFTASETAAASVRGQLSGNGILAATYTRGDDNETSARGPGGNINEKVYGQGYRVSFIPGEAGESEPRVLASVDEINLLTSRADVETTRPWSCFSNLRFRIGRSCVDCACSTDSGQNPETMAVVRRVLQVEHWWVNLNNACVVQKSPAQQCYPNGSVYNNFVSICLRQ